MPFQRQRTKRRKFCRWPVNVAFTSGSVTAFFQNTFELFVNVQACWNVGDSFDNVLERVGRGACFHVVVTHRASVVPFPSPLHSLRVGFVLVLAFGRLEFLFQNLAAIFDNAVGFLNGHLFHLQQPFHVAVANGRKLVDGLIHKGLRESRLVALVVPKAAVAIHINHDIAIELFAEVHRKVDHLSDRFGVFAVDVKDRNLQHLGHVAGVSCRTAHRGIRGKANLIVQDYVQGSASFIARKLAEVERFLNHAFSGKRCVTVNQHGHTFVVFAFTDTFLFAATTSHRHWIDELKMAGVKAQRDVKFLFGRGGPIRAVP